METKITEYFSLYSGDEKSFWLSKIKKAEWNAADFLCRKIEDGGIEDILGKTRLFLLTGTHERELFAFCTLTEREEIEECGFSPWIGWVYVFPSYRGKRFSQTLILHAEKEAAKDGARNVYLYTEKEGLYEKYGYTFLRAGNAVEGKVRIYGKGL